MRRAICARSTEMRKDWLAAMLMSALTGAGLAVLGIYGLRTYGWALFCIAPIAMGFVASAVLRLEARRPLSDAILCTFGGAILASLGFFALGKEGAVCILLAIPIATPFLLIGAIAGYLLLHRYRTPPIPSATAMMGIAIALIVTEHHGNPPTRVVEDSVIVRGSSADVWSAVVRLDALPTPRNWMYRLGLACPQRTRIIAGRAGGYRVCTLSTGQLVEQIEIWNPERRLRWHSHTTPPPMHELNPFYDDVAAPHLQGYYTSPRGEFVLQRIGPNRTRLIRRTWYSQRLYPNAYWSFFCEMAISQIHRTVLEHVRDMVECPSPRVSGERVAEGRVRGRATPLIRPSGTFSPRGREKASRARGASI